MLNTCSEGEELLWNCQAANGFCYNKSQASWEHVHRPQPLQGLKIISFHSFSNFTFTNSR